MTPHYPLNGIDLDFGRYEHRPLGPRDVIVNHLMEDYMSPVRVNPAVYSKLFDRDPIFYHIKSRDRELGLDMQVLSRMLRTDHNWSFTREELQRLYFPPSSIFFDFLGYCMVAEAPATVEQVVLGLVKRHYLETDPSMRIWLKHFHLFRTDTIAKHAPGWKQDMIKHLKKYQSVSRTCHRYCLFSGGHYLPINGPSNVEFSISPNFLGMPWLGVLNPTRARRPSRRPARTGPLVDMEGVHRGRPKRSSSLPPLSAWATAAVQGLDELDFDEKWIIYFPARRLSELDKLSRRRSLSRTHIRAMFSDKPKHIEKKPAKKQLTKDIRNPCANCNQCTHRTSACPSKCGYCNSSLHKASACTIKATNRCKCRPFPQYHTSFECYVRCSRKCGSPYPPGHFKHKNAILCSHRCCMCGSKGHSGRKCSMKKCPCGESHLTQDCRWKVECPAEGCNFYLCHLHCRECGKKKQKGSQDRFVNRTCQECLRNGKPLSAEIERG